MKEALKLALKALQADELDMVDDGSGNMVFRKEQAITTIKEALAQPEQKPVAWAMLHDNGHFIDAIHPDEHARVEGKYIHPLYTTAQRTWVGMTENEAIELLPEGDWEIESTLDFAQAIEAKLRSKNI